MKWNTVGGIDSEVRICSSVLDIILAIQVQMLAIIINYPVNVNYYNHSLTVYCLYGR